MYKIWKTIVDHFDIAEYLFNTYPQKKARVMSNSEKPACNNTGVLMRLKRHEDYRCNLWFYLSSSRKAHHFYCLHLWLFIFVLPPICWRRQNLCASVLADVWFRTAPELQRGLCGVTWQSRWQSCTWGADILYRPDIGQRHGTNINVGEIHFRIAKQQRVIKGAFSCVNMTKLQPSPPGITSEVWNRCVTVPQAFWQTNCNVFRSNFQAPDRRTLQFFVFVFGFFFRTRRKRMFALCRISCFDTSSCGKKHELTGE